MPLVELASQVHCGNLATHGNFRIQNVAEETGMEEITSEEALEPSKSSQEQIVP